MFRQARNAWALLRLDEFSIRYGVCPMCGPTLFIKLAADSLSVRCTRCRGSAIHMSIAQVIRENAPPLSGAAVYEMSSRGPVFNYLKRRAGTFCCSEYFDDIPPGAWKEDVQCQDVQNLTYPTAQFDLCTSTEVFEHVPDDRQGFREILRVLRPGGCLIFTVPFSGKTQTLERAKIIDGRVHHLMAPAYHGDSIRGQHKVLCFRDYGWDIVDRLRECGYRDAALVSPKNPHLWDMQQKIAVALK